MFEDPLSNPQQLVDLEAIGNGVHIILVSVGFRNIFSVFKVLQLLKYEFSIIKIEFPMYVVEVSVLRILCALILIMMSNCAFDKEEKRDEMNEFSYVQSNHNNGEYGRWKWRCREYRASMEM